MFKPVLVLKCLFFGSKKNQPMRFSLKIISVLFLSILFNISFAQAPKRWTSGEIHEAIKKLNVLGSVLYVAAHPDDENTRLISYMANERRMNTAYLSLTRGDGGQNLIGNELSELLGLLRTHELLQARGVDGGKQMFSRANDFGYSKNPDETLKVWNRDEVLSDVVWAIRKFQPDIIINRFSHDSGRRTHGHHTSSAILSHEAFDLTADKTKYPEQLKYVDTWQPRRLFFNTSWWFYGSRDKFAKADKSKMLSVDAGVYYPIKGKSNNEIAAESRSMHKCQGMGSTASRGSLQEYLKLLKGDMPGSKEDPFEGINTTWSRLKGGAPIGKLVTEIDNGFRYDTPGSSLPKLLEARKMITALPDSNWKIIKLDEIDSIIEACMGLFLEVVADDYSATPGEEVALEVEVVNRSKAMLTLKSISYLPMGIDSVLNLTMDHNQPYKWSKTLTLPKDMPATNPYWLNKKGTLGMYAVEDQALRGQPETQRKFKVDFHFELDGEMLSYSKPVVFKKTDPVDGEVYRPFEVTIPIFANIEDKVYVFADEKPKEVRILLKSGKDDVKGNLILCHPEGWRYEPESVDFHLKAKGEEQWVTFNVYPPADQNAGLMGPIVDIDGEKYTKEVQFIEYDHIPTQTIVQNAESKIVKIDLKKQGKNIGYIMGAGDEVPESLRQIGYNVTLLSDAEINADNMAKYDAVVLGIRAYNTVDRLKFHQEKLMKYVENGGVLLVQYNTSRRLKVKDLGPYPIKLSRDRVSVEEAEVRFLMPEHRVLNFPNKITSADFDNWVQERGLYFPDEWDDEYDAILSSNDPGESPKDGPLLVANYGKGVYIYTGLSFFRELPAGVPGAYRLFANLLSISAKP